VSGTFADGGNALTDDCPFCAVGPERIAFAWSHGVSLEEALLKAKKAKRNVNRNTEEQSIDRYDYRGRT
jgi:hypothetical protein